ncbi:hypothetical protein ABT352_12965 [Streptosporangium sp. NPDC000563]|uniref:hypothetical protein n=1 Tax=Streptosporangium sp. NPDC000563 TaxID=3154366 RepID=UPI00331D10B1
MSQGRETVNLYFFTIGAVLLAGLIYFAPWPFWASALLVGALVTSAILVARTASRGTKPDLAPAYSSFVPVTEPEQGRKQVAEIPLPSSAKDYDFLLSATVLWSPAEETTYDVPLNLEGVAVQAIIERAREVTEQWPPEQVNLVQYELSGTLGRVQPVSPGEVHAMAQDVVLTLADDDRKRLDMLATQRKEMAVWEQNKQAEQSRRRYLSEDVLRSPGAAVVWHLDRHGEQVEKTVNDIVQLTQLSLAAHDKLPDGYGADPARLPYEGSGYEPTGHTSTADHVGAMLFTVGFEDTDQQALFAAELADLFARYGRHNMANDLQRRFNQPQSRPTFDESLGTSDAPDANGTGPATDRNGSGATFNGDARTTSGDGAGRPE